MRTIIRLILPLALLVVGSAQAAGRTALDVWLDGLRSLRTDFTQRVQDAQGHAASGSTGRLLVLRPGRFRWQTGGAGSGDADAGQLMVADGRNLWFYDSDLMQVQVKSQGDALSATPMLLLSGGADVRQAFDISSAGAHDGLTWVRVKPVSGEADFRQAMLGFGGNDLRQMVLEDKLGQVMTLVFEHMQRNAAVSDAEVSFTPPPDADVIGTPQK
jgi:outer membrane lipoprotein carrier protein